MTGFLITSIVNGHWKESKTKGDTVEVLALVTGSALPPISFSALVVCLAYIDHGIGPTVRGGLQNVSLTSASVSEPIFKDVETHALKEAAGRT